MRLKFLYVVLLLGVFLKARATHNRAGEIVYQRIAPYYETSYGVQIPVYNYSITVIVYTDHGDAVADRCADTVYFGDGQRGIAYRVNGGYTVSPCSCSGSVQCGEMLVNTSTYKVKKNIYTITHRYPGAGTYTIQMFDPNRNQGVHNIPNSDQQPFYLESLLVISNFSGANSSPTFNCDPIYKACLGKCFYHNPCAYDSDGDSLSYEISTSRGYGGATVPGYFFPETGGGYYGINSTSGLLTWCTPQVKSEYNIAFIVKEWRKNSSNSYVMIGYVLRDMQVVVEACPNNDPPVISAAQDTCVEAGSTLSKKFYVSDPNIGQSVTITGHGGAFATTLTPASLSPSSGPASGYSTTFTWKTACDHIRQQPYQSVLVANDSWSSPLAFYMDYNIRVVPPTIKNVTASPQGSSIKVSWSLSPCSLSVNNPLMAYKIYRRDSCVAFNTSPCQTGIPPNSGFNYIGQTNATTSVFLDNNNGLGLIVGKSYSYLVIAEYKDGTETYSGAQVCAKLTRNIPIITKVDILSTSVTNGSLSVAWERPLTTTGNLDTNIFKGPYTFNLKYRAGSSGTFSTVFTNSSNYFLGLPTSFTHTGINTQEVQAYYQVEFISGTITVGSSPLASSVFLKTTPTDRKIQLAWDYSTPWDNYLFQIWRKNPGSNNFVLIDSTDQNQYLDTKNIANKYNYCYKVRSKGEYSEPGILKPLINNSQESCATATDNVAPCAPTLSISANCPEDLILISWNDVATLPCGDDVILYRLYYKRTIDSAYRIVYEGPLKTYSPDGELEQFWGCYAVSAIDSANNVSSLSTDFCIENCPVFELPNIVTANNDGANDFFMAIRVRQIKEIDLHVYDRWGNIVYMTKDPYFKWNTLSEFKGPSVNKNNMVSEGTFFYICDVFEPRLKGIVKRTIKGYLQVTR